MDIVFRAIIVRIKRIKIMTKKHFFLACLFIVAFAIEAKAQNSVVYAYDNAGNRTERTVVLTKSVQGESNNSEYFKEELGKQVVKIYPNPTDGLLSVEIINISDSDKVSGKLYLYDMTGQLLKKEEINSEKKIEFDLSKNVDGVYLLKIQMKEIESTWKIIKK